MIDASDIPHLPGSLVVDETDAPVGVLVNSYADPDTGQALWASVRRHTGEIPDLFVPLSGASFVDSGTSTVKVATSIGVLAGSPLIHPPFTFTDNTARTLSAYYDRAVAPAIEGADRALPPETTPPSAKESQDAAAWMVRSEEQLRVGSQRVPVERVRLRKVIITEEKTITVTLRREEFQLVREPYDPADAASETSESGPPFDLVLHEERPVVTVQVVPVERVHVDVLRLTDTVAVSADVRKERLEINTRPPADTASTPLPNLITDDSSSTSPDDELGH